MEPFVTTLRGWLAKRPTPASVTVDGKPIVVPSGRKKWNALADTIDGIAKAGQKIVCYDDAGAVIRGMSYAPDDETDESEESKTETGESDIVVFARLLADAQEKVMLRDEALFNRVFDAQNAMMTTFANRLSSLENAWHKQVVESARIQAAMIENAAEANALLTEQAGQGSDLDQVVKAALGGMFAGGSEKDEKGGKS